MYMYNLQKLNDLEREKQEIMCKLMQLHESDLWYLVYCRKISDLNEQMEKIIQDI